MIADLCVCVCVCEFKMWTIFVLKVSFICAESLAVTSHGRGETFRKGMSVDVPVLHVVSVPA